MKFKAVIFIATVLFFAPALASAASLRFELPQQAIFAGDTFSVSVVLDSQQPVNAFSVAVVYPAANVALKSVEDANSIARYWPAPAAFSPYLSLATVQGGLPSPGFSGNGGMIMTMHVLAEKSGSAEFEFASGSKIYLNDGKGTQVSPNLVPAVLLIQNPPPGYVAKVLAPQNNLNPAKNPGIINSPGTKGIVIIILCALVILLALFYRKKYK